MGEHSECDECPRCGSLKTWCYPNGDAGCDNCSHEWEASFGDEDAVEAREVVELAAPDPERIARALHEAYERLAPEHDMGPASCSRRWDELSPHEASLLTATVSQLLESGVILPGADESQGGTRCP